MPHANIKGLLVDATKFPAAIEAALPVGAPRISTMLLDATNQIPAIPDFPVEVPDLPAPPTLPVLPAPPAGLRAPRPFVTAATIRPMAGAAGTPVKQEIIPSPAVGVLPEVITRRGM